MHNGEKLRTNELTFRRMNHVFFLQNFISRSVRLTCTSAHPVYSKSITTTQTDVTYTHIFGRLHQLWKLHTTQQLLWDIFCCSKIYFAFVHVLLCCSRVRLLLLLCFGCCCCCCCCLSSAATVIFVGFTQRWQRKARARKRGMGNVFNPTCPNAFNLTAS